jgi:hypothetical protein
MELIPDARTASELVIKRYVILQVVELGVT